MRQARRKSYGAGGAREAQREATKAALIDAAEALYASEPADTVTVTEIAERAGVSASLINAHFGSRDGLLYAVVDRSNAPRLAAIQAAVASRRKPGTKLEAAIRSCAEADLRNPRLLAAMRSYSWIWPEEIEARNRETRSEVESILAGIVREGVEKGEFRDLDIARAVTTIRAIYIWGLRAGVFEDRSAEDCADAITAQAFDLLAR